MFIHYLYNSLHLLIPNSQSSPSQTLPVPFLLLLFCFWLLWVFVAARVFSSFEEPGLLSGCSAQALITAVSHLVARGLQGAWAQQL